MAGKLDDNVVLAILREHTRQFNESHQILTTLAMQAKQEQDQRQALRKVLDKTTAFVACDASAISYLSLGEYRTALLKMLRQAPDGKDAGA
ncbi:hypothetical protein OYC61_014120 [Alcaligenes nematophilus]|uniref:Uncharacterized protein n=1 Tax=Alcaligenes nematophilus TaxID=2994643 RepID=A0ABU3MV26_9BURK|nr:hypothetical protein [Alcaligenes nematophilus]MDT8505436.1 hypothetical protein [Alcaligenes nematophilus]MDT8526059.1 hypothetical protein [Alcaligenes nematophilus]